MVGILMQLIEGSTPLRANAILRCLSIYMRSLGTELAVFYPDLCTWLKEIITADLDEEASLLRARAIEAFGYIGNCVEFEQFGDDGVWFLEIVVKADWSELTEDEIDQSQKSLSRIITMNEAFQEYVEPVVNKLLENVQKNPDVEEHSQYDPEITTINKDKLVILLDTNFVEMPKANKSIFDSALDALGDIMVRVGEQFTAYFSDFCKAAASACLRYFFPDTQISALKQLRRCAVFVMKYMLPHSYKFILHAFRSIFNMFDKVNHPSVVEAILDTLAFILTKLSQLPKTEETTAIIIELLGKMPKAIESLKESESLYLETNQIEELISSIFMILFDNFAQPTGEFFSQSLQEILPIGGGEPSILSLYCWTYFVKSIEQPEESLVIFIKTNLFQCAHAENYSIAAVAFYCIGSLIDQGLLNEDIGECISIACSQLAIYDEHGDIAKAASDGAVYMLNNVINTMDEPNMEIIQTWFDHLPFISSTEKSRSVYLTLTDIIAQDSLEINDHNIRKLVEIVATVIGSSLIDSEMESRFKTYFRDFLMSNQYAVEVIKSALAGLDEDGQSKIHALVSN
jgi:hypothetical protein